MHSFGHKGRLEDARMLSGRGRYVSAWNLPGQRPDKETVRGAIKANLNARVVLRLPTIADSMTVLGKSGAEKLMPAGDLLLQTGS